MQAYYTTLFISLDIGKNVHWCAAYAGYDLKEVVKPCKVRSNQAGFEQVSRLIDGLLESGQYERVVIGHEPTGLYHENWACALYERYVTGRDPDLYPQVAYQFVNPLLSKRKRLELTKGRQRKTDPIDLRAIGYCLRDGQGQPAFVAEAQNFAFQLWGRAYRRNRRHNRDLTTKLLAQLDRLWPGLVVNTQRFAAMHPDLEPPVPLVLSKPLERQRLRAIIQHCPNPYDFRALDQAHIQAFFRQHLGRCGQATAQLAFDLIQQALLPPPDLASLLADQLHLDFERYLQLERHFESLVEQALLLVPYSPAAVLTTVPGVSPVLAARYLAHLGHPQRFASAAQIWAFAGFDLVTEQSGDFRRLGHISRKGDPGLRDTLFLIGLHTAHQLPAIARAKQRALKRGKGFVAATIHAAHKANRLLHHLLYHQRPFDPDRLR